MTIPNALQPPVLVVEDEPTIREALCAVIDEAGYDARAASGIEAARDELARACPAAVLLDIRLRDGDGLELLAELRRRWPNVPVIMATAYGDSERTITAMKLGAFDYVTKPFDLDALLATVSRAVHTPTIARVEACNSESGFVGKSSAMLAVWKAIGRAAVSDVPVLITGESGVGKELVARAIHQHSARRDAPFVAVNMAALAPALIESELFGHERGAFTGAHARRQGRFELASQGTLFLDEIGDLLLTLQSKLLRVLEDGSYERVGGTTPLVSSARVVAATSRMLAQDAMGTSLRDDLYYRLGVVRIHVPPLRERKEDIPLLVGAFLRRVAGGNRTVSEQALQRLIDYDWPGNVRQLRHVLQNACVMSAAEVLDVPALRLPEHAPTAGATESKESLHTQLEQLERRLIERALKHAQGNRAEAARALGIRRGLLYARIKQFGLVD